MYPSIRRAYGQRILSMKACSKGLESAQWHSPVPGSGGSFCQQPFNLPGYVRVDAAVYYRNQAHILNKKTNLIASVNIRNLLDERYFTGAQNFREIIYTGAPFTVVGSLKLEY